MYINLETNNVKYYKIFSSMIPDINGLFMIKYKRIF